MVKGFTRLPVCIEAAHNPCSCRIAGSNPAPATNSFRIPVAYRVYHPNSRAENSMSGCPTTSRGEFNSTMRASRGGQRETARGQFGKAKRCLARPARKLGKSVETTGPRNWIFMPSPVRVEAAHNPCCCRIAGSNPAPATKPLAARGPLRKVQRRSFERIAIQSSSVVERSAVNRLVVGSNPTSGAKF